MREHEEPSTAPLTPTRRWIEERREEPCTGYGPAAEAPEVKEGCHER
jgi:hypothetical protein